MFKTWFIGRLTQLSTWVGLIIVLGSIFLSPLFNLVFGCVLFFNEDKWFSAKFVKARDWLERNWK